MIFSNGSIGKLTKTIQPGQLEFFMHAEAAPDAEEIARVCQVNYREQHLVHR